MADFPYVLIYAKDTRRAILTAGVEESHNGDLTGTLPDGEAIRLKYNTWKGYQEIPNDVVEELLAADKLTRLSAASYRRAEGLDFDGIDFETADPSTAAREEDR